MKRIMSVYIEGPVLTRLYIYNNSLCEILLHITYKKIHEFMEK